MANLKEQPVWEAGIYQWETADPVLGGENGIDNMPTRQLANRTLWLKNALAEAIENIGNNKADKATTLAGYGITNAYTKTEIDDKIKLKLDVQSPLASGSLTVRNGTHPAVRLQPSSGETGLIIESSGGSHYMAIRPVDTLGSSAGQIVAYFFPSNKTGSKTIAVEDEVFAFGNLGILDLNTVSKPGSYGQDKNVNATTARNYPFLSAGRLDVSPGPYGVMQEYTSITGAKAIRYATNTNLSTWGDWTKLSTLINKLSDTDNLNNIRVYGSYGQDVSSKALASLNYPYEEAGTLDVKIGTYGFLQLYQTISGRIAIRRAISATEWSAWTELAMLAVNNLTSDSISQPLAAAQGKALANLIADKLPKASPVAAGSITLSNATYPSVRLEPKSGTHGLVMESSGTQQYFAVRPKDTLSSSAGQKALFSLPDKTGSFTLATTDESLAFGNLGTTNLNSVSRYGSYGQDQNANATTARNYPYGQAGRLDVSSGPYGVMQEYTSITGAKAVRYATKIDLSEWGEWVKLSTLVSKLDVADNLNNQNVYGIYGQDTSSRALASLNYPAEEAGTLEVKIGTYGLMQTYLTISGRLFIRRGQPSNAWSAWVELAQLAIDNLTSTSSVQPLAAAQGKALDEKKLDKLNPTGTGSVTMGNSSYPSFRLDPTAGNAVVFENSGTQQYFSVRPKASIGSSTGQLALFALPMSKTGNHTFAMLADFASVLSSTGRLALPDGTLLQWGLVSMAPNSTAVVTLPLAVSSILQAFCTYDLPTASEYPTIAVGGFTATTMTVGVKAASGSNYGVRWFAICKANKD